MSQARYLEIADALRARIRSGEYPVGSRLPSIASLESEFDVSLQTVRSAQKVLVEDGLIRLEQGVGAWVIATSTSRTVDVDAQLATAQEAIAKVQQARLDRRPSTVDETAYTTVENSWTWTSRRNPAFTQIGPLYLRWEVWGDPITDDYRPEEIGADELLRMWLKHLPDQGTEATFGAGAVGLNWTVTGEGTSGVFEAAPFQMRLRTHQDFLTYFSWPVSTVTGERVNFNRLPVLDKLWRDGRGDKGGFIQSATGWKPAALQPVMWIGSVMAAASLAGPSWKARS